MMNARVYRHMYVSVAEYTTARLVVIWMQQCMHCTIYGMQDDELSSYIDAAIVPNEEEQREEA